MDYLNGLNLKQADAVLHKQGPCLVLAGAGSGKTRVLTHRIGHLIAQGFADPTQIFAVTFTNKAAGEMRHRVLKLLHGMGFEVSERDLWVNTFHSACVRILRSEIRHLGYDSQFTIYDDSDQRSVIKACFKELNLSESTFNPKSIQGKINKAKNDGFEAATFVSKTGGPFEDAFIRVFQRYTEILKMSSALDFADLILLTVKLLKTQPKVLKAFHERWKYILIDEYQDTNKCQYELIKLLGGEGNVFAVGDEDQSIYRWRGADIQNILNFEKDFPNTVIHKLEQNYQSTKNIIEAASHVISRNSERRDKTLWTENEPGSKLQVQEAYDEHDEADKMVHDVLRAQEAGESLNQIAVFYRTNAQSRLLEDRFRSRNINYQIFGGLKFYDRLEVKDALAYLKLVCNPKDDVSFRRIVNVPTRGVGAVSLSRFSDQALDFKMSLYEALDASIGNGSVNIDFGRSQKNFSKFYSLMVDFIDTAKSILPSDLLGYVLEKTGYKDSLMSDGSVESVSRLENLAELRQSMVEYELMCGAERPNEAITLAGFLEQIALVSDLDRFEPNAPSVKMMTIHMAKGLEFDRVYIVGLEEELFPNMRAWEGENDTEVEEERRLFYVGMTRARKALTLMTAKNRTVFGNAQFRVMSRFIDEIPADYLEMKKADYFSRKKHYLDRPGLPPRSAGDGSFPEEYSQINTYDDFSQDGANQIGGGLRPGERVEHPLFGRGVIRKNVGPDKVMVEFTGSGLKKISVKFGLLKHL